MGDPVNELEAKQLWDYYKFRVPFDVYLSVVRGKSVPEIMSREAERVQLELENETTTDERKAELLEQLLATFNGRFPA
jgi:hypothetical protein